MKPKYLIGKTIKSAKTRGIKGYDDKPYLDIEFTDGTKVTIEADYGAFTGKSAIYEKKIRSKLLEQVRKLPQWVDIDNGWVKLSDVEKLIEGGE